LQAEKIIGLKIPNWGTVFYVIKAPGFVALDLSSHDASEHNIDLFISDDSHEIPLSTLQQLADTQGQLAAGAKPVAWYWRSNAPQITGQHALHLADKDLKAYEIQLRNNYKGLLTHLQVGGRAVTALCYAFGSKPFDENNFQNFLKKFIAQTE
jgi:hypothetical protein